MSDSQTTNASHSERLSPAERRKAAVAREPQAVLYESIDGVALITINRPRNDNQLSCGVLEMLHDCWIRLNESDDRCAVVTGNNEVFSAGGGLDEFTIAAMADELYMFFRGIPGGAVTPKKPLIGAVAGLVQGGGFTLASRMDLIIAAENTHFTYPEVHVSAGGGWIGALSTRVPYQIAMQVLLGEPLSVQRAYDVGFVNEIVPVGQQVEAAMKYARRIANAGPIAVSWFKSLVERTVPKSPAETTGKLLGELEGLLASEDLREFIASYQEGRQPHFKGK